MEPITARPSISPTINSGCTLTAYTMVDDWHLVYRDDQVVNYHALTLTPAVTVFPSIKSDTVIGIFAINGGG